MASDKKFTPKEAAVAVLKKAEELYKSSTLAKGDWAKIHSKLKREGYSEESADKIDGAIKAKMGKSEEIKKGDMPTATPSPAPTTMPTINQQIGSPFGKAEGSEAPMKGHIKLAKFMGRMEHKRGAKGETGHEKGVHTSVGDNGKSQLGGSQMGLDARIGGKDPGAVASMKQESKQVLGEMKNIKPKLPG